MMNSPGVLATPDALPSDPHVRGLSREQMEAFDEAFDAPLLLGYTKRQQREAKLLAWGAETILSMRAKMPNGFTVTAPVPVVVRGLRGNLDGCAWGYNGWSDPVIGIAPKTYEKGKAEVRRVLMHELLHIHLGRSGVKESAHGPMFQKFALYFGLKGWGDKNWRYKWKCPECGWWVRSHKKFTVVPCPKHSGGPTVYCRRTTVVKVSRSDRAKFLGLPPPEKKPWPTKDETRAKRLAAVRAKIKRSETRLKRWTTMLRRLRASERALARLMEAAP